MIELTKAQIRALTLLDAHGGIVWANTQWGEDKAPARVLSALHAHKLAQRHSMDKRTGYTINAQGQEWLDSQENPLDGLVRKLHEARKQHAATVAEFNAEYDKLADLRYKRQLAEERMKSIETTLREAAIAQYDDDNPDSTKQPHEKVTIKLHTTLEYSEDTAADWAKENARYMFKFDVKAFESHAKRAELPFVEKHKVPKAYIAKDLSDE